MNIVVALVAAPLFIAFTLGMTVLRNAVAGMIAPQSINVSIWGGVVVGTQALATWGSAMTWLRVAGYLDRPPSLFYLCLFAFLGTWIVWQWADEAEWTRVTGWIASPDDREAREEDAVEEVSTRALLIGTVAGSVLTFASAPSLPLFS